MEMKRQDFSFELPQELIAQDPFKDRSSSRILVLQGHYRLSESGGLSGNQ